MKRIFGIFVAAALAAAISSGQIVRDYYGGAILVAVPSSGTGGQPGGSGNPANVTALVANADDSILIGNVLCYVTLNHARVSDLTISLSHCGTTVTLFAGSPNQYASVNGTYSFSDSAPSSFAGTVNQAFGLVPPAQYQPSQSLSAFTGKNATGPWTLSITDLVSGVSGSAGYMTIEVASGTTFGGPTNLSIPDGANGVCLQPVTQYVNVPSQAKIGMVYVRLGLTHTYTSDLTIMLSHEGVSATIMSYNTPVSGANLAGTYTFEDDAVSSWEQAVAGLPSSATVASGYYRPLSPLSAFRGLDQQGPWYLTICDSGTADVGTLSELSISIATSGWDLQLQQPGGPSALILTNTGGSMGNAYVNLITLTPGAFPNGWFYGIDIDINDIAFQVSVGPPFFGTLNICGSAATVVPGPIPTGLSCYVTSLELGQSGSIVSVKPAFFYMTQ